VRPPLPTDELDFSQAHFLDHSLWVCRGGPHRYGGRRGHLQVAWRYVWREQLRAATTCRIGRHRRVEAWQARRGVFHICGFCGKTMP
jgi:hypothetical protein